MERGRVSNLNTNEVSVQLLTFFPFMLLASAVSDLVESLPSRGPSLTVHTTIMDDVLRVPKQYNLFLLFLQCVVVPHQDLTIYNIVEQQDIGPF